MIRGMICDMSHIIHSYNVICDFFSWKPWDLTGLNIRTYMYHNHESKTVRHMHKALCHTGYNSNLLRFWFITKSVSHNPTEVTQNRCNCEVSAPSSTLTAVINGVQLLYNDSIKWTWTFCDAQMMTFLSSSLTKTGIRISNFVCKLTVEYD